MWYLDRMNPKLHTKIVVEVQRWSAIRVQVIDLLHTRSWCWCLIWVVSERFNSSMWGICCTRTRQWNDLYILIKSIGGGEEASAPRPATNCVINSDHRVCCHKNISNYITNKHQLSETVLILTFKIFLFLLQHAIVVMWRCLNKSGFILLGWDFFIHLQKKDNFN